MWSRIKNSVPLNLLLIFAAAVVAVGAQRVVREALTLRAELGDTGTRMGAIKRQKAEIAGRLAELEAPEAVEREAKAKFNLKKPGEEVVVVAPDKRDMLPPVSTLWERIRRFFAEIF